MFRLNILFVAAFYSCALAGEKVVLLNDISAWYCWGCTDTSTAFEEWLDEISYATFLVSGRFHHFIAAFCLNTPFIALNSNTHKVHALCSFLDQPEPLLYSDPQLFERLLARTQIILVSPVVSNEEKIAEICLLIDKNFIGLKDLQESYQLAQ